jgi:hypothetical protein
VWTSITWIIVNATPREEALMSEVDPRFGRPNKADDPDREMQHACDEIFNEWTKGFKKSLRPLIETSEILSDQTTAMMTGLFGNQAALDHSKEIEGCAQRSIESKDDEGAKHFLKRDLAFSMWTLGYDNTQTKSIQSQLDRLENPPLETARQASSAAAKIHIFEDPLRSR